MKRIRRSVFLLFFVFGSSMVFSQNTDTLKPSSKSSSVNDDVLGVGSLKINLNSKGDRWMSFAISSQVWMRYIQNNPGTMTHNGYPQDNTYDVGMRRMRIVLQSQLHPLYNIYLQMGTNNQSFSAGGAPGTGVNTGTNGLGKKASFFFLDLYNEVAIIPRINIKTGKTNNYNLYIGAGLHSWNGVSRMTSASSTKMLAADLPVLNFPTIEDEDQFARQMGIFVHGDLNRFNYRFSINKPFATNSIPTAVGEIVRNNRTGNLSCAGYVNYQFFDKENITTAFFSGNYMATKKLLTIGAGFLSSPNSTLSLEENKELKTHNINVFGADITVELPMGPKTKAMGLSLYSVFYNYDYGPNYIRLSGLLNPGVKDPNFKGTKMIEGAGNNRVLFGTGNIWYTQAGFTLPRFKIFTLQPYITYSLKNMKALNEVGHYFDIGTSLYFFSSNSRIALQYLHRPLYDESTKKTSIHRGEILLLFQITL